MASEQCSNSTEQKELWCLVNYPSGCGILEFRLKPDPTIGGFNDDWYAWKQVPEAQIVSIDEEAGTISIWKTVFHSDGTRGQKVSRYALNARALEGLSEMPEKVSEPRLVSSARSH